MYCNWQDTYTYRISFHLIVSRLLILLTPDLGSKASASSTPGTTCSPILTFREQSEDN